MGAKASKAPKPTLDLGHLSQRKLASAIESYVSTHGESFGLLQRYQRADRIVYAQPGFEIGAADEDQGSVWKADLRVVAWLDDTADGDAGIDADGENEDDGEEGDFVFSVRIERGKYTCTAAERA